MLSSQPCLFLLNLQSLQFPHVVEGSVCKWSNPSGPHTLAQISCLPPPVRLCLSPAPGGLPLPKIASPQTSYNSPWQGCSGFLAHHLSPAFIPSPEPIPFCSKAAAFHDLLRVWERGAQDKKKGPRFQEFLPKCTQLFRNCFQLLDCPCKL